MTIKEALNSDLLDVLEANVIEKLLIDQDLDEDKQYNKAVGASKEYQLAYAYGICKIVLHPNWSQGDMSQSWNSKDDALKMASAIFNKYGVQDITGKSSTIRSIKMW